MSVSRWPQALYAAAKNGSAMACSMDATKFILAYPRGAYTSARTVGHTKVFDYEAHLQRLVDSTIAMGAGSERTVANGKEMDAVLRPRTEATLQAAMKLFKDQHGDMEAEDYKLTVLICTDEDDKSKEEDVYCHIGLLPPLRNGLVKLQIAGLPRSNASAKDSTWVRDRKAIYDAMPKDVEEVILMDPESHALPEGSQTNFYTILEGAVVTAEDGILKGTVRSLVLDVCRELGIPVILRPPCLDDIDSWEGCFISSTSRLVLGASCIEYVDPSSKQQRTRSFETTSILEKVIERVRDSVDQRSTQVFD